MKKAIVSLSIIGVAFLIASIAAYAYAINLIAEL
jgi:hypothetical protein